MAIPKRIRIAVVIPKYGLVGGAEGFAAELAERIARDENYDVHVFANTWKSLSKRISFHKVPIIRFPKFLTTPSFAFFVGRQLAKEPFDLIHTHDRIFQADLYTLHGIPHRVWIHDVRKKRFMSLFDHATAWVEKKLVTGNGCRRFLAVSTLTRNIFLGEYPMHTERVPVIHPGITIKPFSGKERADHRLDMRRRFGISPADTVILFVSMNFDIKGLDAVMAGMGRLRRQDPAMACRLLVVGKGNESHYRSIAQGLGIADRVVFSGVVDKQTLEKIYLSADIFAMLSKFDTFGLVVLEAMAASLPVLISSTVGGKDIIKEGLNGFVIEDTKNITDIAEKLKIMLAEGTRRGMAQEAFQTACQYSWESSAAKVLNIYQELLNGSVHHYRLL